MKPSNSSDPLFDLEEMWKEEDEASEGLNHLEESTPETHKALGSNSASREAMSDEVFESFIAKSAATEPLEEELDFSAVFAETESADVEEKARSRRYETRAKTSTIKNHDFESRRFREESEFMQSLGFTMTDKKKTGNKVYDRTLHHNASGKDILIGKEWILLSKIYSHEFSLKSPAFPRLCKKTTADPQFLLDICQEYACEKVVKDSLEKFITMCTTEGYEWQNHRNKGIRKINDFSSEENAVANALGFTNLRKNDKTVKYSRVVFHNKTGREIVVPCNEWRFIPKVVKAGLENSINFKILCEASQEEPEIALKAFQEYGYLPHKNTTPDHITVSAAINNSLRIFGIDVTSKKRHAEESPITTTIPVEALHFTSIKKRGLAPE